MPHPELRQAWLDLANHFIDRVVSVQPRSVLDVGCGSGRLLERLRTEGIAASGVEVEESTVAKLREAGLDAHCAPAAALPFEDDAFDLVCMRHVPHHLPDVNAALGEAVRVAVSGLLIAEPYFDVQLPGQRLALRWDLWSKRRDEAAGHLHRPVISPAELLAALPVEFAFEATVETYMPLVEVPAHVLLEESRSYRAALPEQHAETSELEAILQQSESEGLTYNGTAIVAVRLD